MRHKFRFSIAVLLVLMLASALLIKWTTAPINSQEEGVEEWTEMGILSHSIAIVQVSYPGDRWEMCSIMLGDGNYCHLSEGGSVLNSTGGWFYSMGVQLPGDLYDGWTSELMAITDHPDGNVRKLVPGEVVASQFGNPSAWGLVSGIEGSLGTITVLKAGKEHVTIKVTAKIPLRGMIEAHDEVVLDIDRTFELDIMSPEHPLQSIPRKFQITKR